VRLISRCSSAISPNAPNDSPLVPDGSPYKLLFVYISEATQAREMAMLLITILSGTAISLFLPSCSQWVNPNCENISAANINTENYYRCCPFPNFDFPSGVTSIGRGTFEKTGLTSLVIPESVTTIGIDAFRHCENLTTVTWNPSENAAIAVSAFGGSGLTSIVIPESVTSIGDGAFSDTRNLRNWQIYPTIDLNDSQFEFCGCDPPADDDDYGDDDPADDDEYNGTPARRARREVAASCPTSGPSFVCDCGPCAKEDVSDGDAGLKYGLIAGGVVIFGVGVAALVYTKFGRSILGLSTSGQLISDSL